MDHLHTCTVCTYSTYLVYLWTLRIPVLYVCTYLVFTHLMYVYLYRMYVPTVVCIYGHYVCMEQVFMDCIYIQYTRIRTYMYYNIMYVAGICETFVFMYILCVCRICGLYKHAHVRIYVRTYVYTYVLYLSTYLVLLVCVCVYYVCVCMRMFIHTVFIYTPA